MALDKMLQEKRMDRLIPRNKRKDMLRDLGYVPHPALKNGRVDNNVQFDGGKPRLYVKRDHINCNINNHLDVAKVYQSVQIAQLSKFDAQRRFEG